VPNRIIKESLCTSEKISDLTDFEFRLWIGLITQADDAGRGDARPAIIKGRIFPLRERVTARDIDASLHALAAKGCVSLYTVGGKPYFWFPGWADHQRVRDVKPKYPSPEEDELNCTQLKTGFDNPPQIAADCGFNPIQSNPNPNPNPNTNRRAGAHFTPPTLEEVQEYCTERGNGVDPQRFIDYYTANGWLVGKNKMKDWKACVRTWEKNSFQASSPTKEKAFNTMQSRTDFDFDEIERRAQRQLQGGNG
jgi:hypothetical protein